MFVLRVFVCDSFNIPTPSIVSTVHVSDVS